MIIYLKEILSKENRILVLSDTCPPEEEARELEERLCRLGSDDTSVHLLASIPVTMSFIVQQYTNVPFEIHTALHWEPGGRFEGFAPVRAWRTWRIRRNKRRQWNRMLKRCLDVIQPTKLYTYIKGKISETTVRQLV